MTTSLYFVHVPKTGGTSFRLAAEEQFGSQNILYDYGPKARETSPLIRERHYDNGQMLEIKYEVERLGIRLISGHMSATKYACITGLENTIAFMREPVAQLVSMYRHFVRDHGYEGTCEDFMKSKRYNSIQSNHLNIPLEALGFVGLTEHYNESVATVNDLFGTSIPVRLDNVTEQKPREKTTVTDEMLELASRNSASDQALYRRALLSFRERQRMKEGNHHFVHGTVTKFNLNAMSGFAFVRGGDEAIKVHVEVNGDAVGEPSFARSFRPHLAAFKVPRDGFVGFDIKMPKVIGSDEVKCVVSDTGQVLWQRSGPEAG